MAELEKDWFNDYNNIVRLVEWMLEQGEYDANDIVAAVRKPWHYKEEYLEALKEEANDTAP